MWPWAFAVIAAVGAPSGDPVTADSPHPVFAVIIGNNRSLDPDVPPLRFADDDAIRYYEMFSFYADRVALFVVPDMETQRLFRSATAQARPPSRQAVLSKLRAFFAEMGRERDAGREPVFYFVYSGHGDVGENREGYVNLLDDRFTRSDLYREVIAASPAAFNHVIIDACNSYFMVSSRGGWRNDRVGVSDDDLLSAYVAQQDLASYPNTGVVLSTSSAQETHEWSAYGAGVFSHQLRSGLLGTADVNADGRIEYSEIKAYIAAANGKVDDPKARISLYARPPEGNLSEPLFDIQRLRSHAYLQLGPADKGRLYIEDARGVRYADFNKAAEAPLQIALLSSPFYYVRDDAREIKVQATAGQVVSVSDERWGPLTRQARGSTSESFRRDLYQVPYGPSFYHGYVSSHGDIPVADLALLSPPPPGDSARAFLTEPLETTVEQRIGEDAAPPFYKRWWFWTAVGGVAASAVGGAVLLGTQGKEIRIVPPSGSIGTVDTR
jgi:hypothetical protein